MKLPIFQELSWADDKSALKQGELIHRMHTHMQGMMLTNTPVLKGVFNNNQQSKVELALSLLIECRLQ